MKLLANENVPKQAVDALRRRGHDVFWARTHAPGWSDQAVLELAQAQDRIVLTFDKDFGELAFRFGLSASCGIVLFRIPSRSPASVARKLIAVLEGRDDWTGHFAVVEPHRVRLRPLPAEDDRQD